MRSMSVDVRPFGELPDGRRVDRIELSAGDVDVAVLTYGGTLASLRGPDAAGDVADVVLGFDSLEGWLQDPQFFGSVVGRYANRIRNGRFTLDGVPRQVARNRGAHCLHGGAAGFDKAVWSALPFERQDAVGVTLTHHSPDGDEGFPGALDATVTYALDSEGRLIIDYEAATDSPTVVNLSNHAYFNLAGSGTILDHVVTLHAAQYLPVDVETIPTGQVAGVEGTPMDFRHPHAVGGRIGAAFEQLHRAGGYDHCWVVDGRPGTARPCAEVVAGGRKLAVATTQPGVQLYSGNGIRPRTGRGGVRYGAHSGLCLETQHFPDSPNHPHFPSTRVGPSQRYAERAVFELSPA